MKPLYPIIELVSFRALFGALEIQLRFGASLRRFASLRGPPKTRTMDRTMDQHGASKTRTIGMDHYGGPERHRAQIRVAEPGGRVAEPGGRVAESGARFAESGVRSFKTKSELKL